MGNPNLSPTCTVPRACVNLHFLTLGPLIFHSRILYFTEKKAFFFKREEEHERERSVWASVWATAAVDTLTS